MTFAAMILVVMLLFIPGLQLMDPNTSSGSDEERILTSPDIPPTRPRQIDDPVIQAVRTSYPPSTNVASLPTMTYPIIPAGKSK